MALQTNCIGLRTKFQARFSLSGRSIGLEWHFVLQMNRPPFYTEVLPAAHWQSYGGPSQLGILGLFGPVGLLDFLGTSRIRNFIFRNFQEILKRFKISFIISFQNSSKFKIFQISFMSAISFCFSPQNRPEQPKTRNFATIKNQEKIQVITACPKVISLTSVFIITLINLQEKINTCSK